MTRRDRLRAALRRLLEGAGVDPRAFYGGKVLQNYASGAVDIRPDSADIPPMTRVPVRVFSAGSKTRPKAGALCLFGFEEKDLARPFVAWFSAGDTQELTLEGDAILVGGGATLEAARRTDPVQVSLWLAPSLAGKISGGLLPPPPEILPVVGAVPYIPVTLEGSITGGSSVVRVK